MILSFNINSDWWDEKEWLLAHSGVSLESEDGGEALVRFELPCRHLIPSTDGRPAACRIHGRKPKVCVDYPDDETVEYLKGRPWLTPGCGYLARD